MNFLDVKQCKTGFQHLLESFRLESITGFDVLIDKDLRPGLGQNMTKQWGELRSTYSMTHQTKLDLVACGQALVQSI